MGHKRLDRALDLIGKVIGVALIVGAIAVAVWVATNAGGR